ncbi:MAG: peptidoglycan-associated lipoprotein Pal [Desulfobacterales bacterium]|nr:MAG: peptidoglycan-associated lipoprotein Pal [Desulfobacterales bacterium]
MKCENWTSVVLVLMMAAILVVPSCGKKRISSVPYSTPTLGEEAPMGAGDASELKEETLGEENLGEARLREKMDEERQASERELFQNEDIHFAFDSSALSLEAQEILRKKAQWLRENRQVKVIIEGHCDNRGTNEYNLALGDRRAESARLFFVDLGLDPSRLNTVSYGEERPIDPGSSEEAQAKNRRAHFVVED